MSHNEPIKCFEQHIGERHAVYNGDSCEVIKGIPDNVIDFTIYSPPFANLYIYSDSIRDMGNCANDAEFFEQYEYLVPELLRVTRPGRLCAVHCKNLVNYKGRDGRAGLRDFRGEIIRVHEKHGWQFHSEITIWKDPVIEMQRTKAHGLLHKQVCTDSSFSRQGLPDYLVMFRKWADNSNASEVQPVTRGSANARFNEYAGTGYPNEPLETNDAAALRKRSIEVWQRYASPVWFDINQTRVLNVQQARISEDEKHLCPLQLDVIERAVELWTNPNDLVFTPFMGIGSEVVVPLQMGRRALGVELKKEYFDVAVRNIEATYVQKSQLSMFDTLDYESAMDAEIDAEIAAEASLPAELLEAA